MKTMQIKIRGITDAAMFAEYANEQIGDIIVKKGKFCVDGKSILGILSLDMTNGATVEYPEDATNFENFIKKFKV